MRKRILSLLLVVYMVLPCLFFGACTKPTESVPPVTEWYTTSKYNPNDYAFSFMVVGDTQVVSRRSIQALADGTVTNGNTYMDMIYDYIVDNVQKKKVKHVIGLGDITDYNSKSEWLEAQRVISKMDGIVPYSLTPGNHDGSTKWFAYSVLKNIPGEKNVIFIRSS